MSKIYIAASWKQKDRVNKIAHVLSERGHIVFDFTDNTSRMKVNQALDLDFQLCDEQPKTKYASKYEPQNNKYGEYLQNMHLYQEMMKNNLAIIKKCDICILLLPAGADAHSDWGAAIGAKKITCVVGYPENGERSPCHLWAHAFFQDDKELFEKFESFDRSFSQSRITD
jgi:hypothetical protein